MKNNLSSTRNAHMVHIGNFIRLKITPGIRPNASGAATVSPDGKQVSKNFITN